MVSRSKNLSAPICRVSRMLFGQRSGEKTVRSVQTHPSRRPYTESPSLDEFDSYIILSFVNGTLVLSIGETVEEVTDTGFLSSAPTLAVQQMGEDALIQVYPRGIRHIQAGGRVNEWPAPQHRTIVAASTNEKQVAIALSSGEI